MNTYTLKLDGSSSRVWGTPLLEQLDRVADRFIPTGVGNTRRSTCSARSSAVHPHGCGEHEGGSVPISRGPGSSPRVWGTPSPSFVCVTATRFIPTGVGNTCPAATPECARAVHPHGCGEHPASPMSAMMPPGSSPRVWGTLVGKVTGERDGRFIPTGVGNTHPERGRARPAAVHPHGCGEHALEPIDQSWSTGSSPRVWGTPRDRRIFRDAERFIPTGVGNTIPSPVMPFVNPVHPHGCGEHRIVAKAS